MGTPIETRSSLLLVTNCIVLSAFFLFDVLIVSVCTVWIIQIITKNIWTSNENTVQGKFV